jgi:hypothetical protein
MPPAQAADEPSLVPLELADPEVDPDAAAVPAEELEADEPDELEESLLAAGTEAEDPLRESVR